ncbi:uncharacterized protein LOC132265415 [Phlebotomus argentipes]|uniref:uncharacterized protein LOC132265415 n=1 Tax=Phlebotomus argentipes TaxID=94469 RepID=UPI002892B94A|nr:uncharacterized protein LOC132265415 [Phlebotomus argentipes]
MAQRAEVHVNVADYVVARDGAEAILVSLVKYLAVQRRQIPYSYTILCNLSDRVRQQETEAPSWKEFQLDKQRKLVNSTVLGYKQLFQAIHVAFANKVQEAVLLFGATAFTPKEAWWIEFPESVQKHDPGVVHHGKVQEMADHTVMTISGRPELSENMSRDFHTTNMYLMLKFAGEAPKESRFREAFTERDVLHLPTSCHVSKITLQNEPTNETLANCCAEMSVFGFSGFTGKARSYADLFRRNATQKTEESRWYECAESVKGYNHVLVKGKDIWNL